MEVIGWGGFFLYILAYGLLSLKIIKVSFFYYLLNLLAGIATVAVSLYKGTYPTASLNFMIVVITLLGMFKVDLHLPFISRKGMYTGLLVAILITFFLHLLSHTQDSVYLFFDVLGWGAAILYLFAYYLLIDEQIDELYFNYINVLYSFLILGILYVTHNWPVFTGIIIWLLIAIVGIFRHYRNPTLQNINVK